MRFNNHSDLLGSHAFLSASKYHWVNYTDEKLEESYKKVLAAQKGSELHDLASKCIKLGVKLAKGSAAINAYVNDGIGYKMLTEQVLFYSFNAFGTADCICFRKNFLRIHDLKTGESRVSMIQLRVYAALFCLEYHEDPHKINIELRIYQGEETIVDVPDPDEIKAIMDKLIAFDKKIEILKSEMED